MKLNDFIRAITALCKEEQNPEVVDDYGLEVSSVDYVDGNIVISYDEALPMGDEEEEEVEVEDDEPEEDTPVLKIV